MKKIVSILLVLILIFALSACKKENSTSSESDIDTESVVSSIDTATQNITNSNNEVENDSSLIATSSEKTTSSKPIVSSQPATSSRPTTSSKPSEPRKPAIENTPSNNDNFTSTQTPTVTYKDIKIGKWSLTKKSNYPNFEVVVIKYIFDFDMSDNEIWNPQGQCREKEFYPISRLSVQSQEFYRNQGNVIEFEGSEYYDEGFETFLAIENIVAEHNEFSFDLEYIYYPEGSNTSVRANTNVKMKQINDNEIIIISMDVKHPSLSIGDIFQRTE